MPPPPAPSPAATPSAEVLRRLLQALKPTGPDGFEGLLADVLAVLAGLHIRLAKSGSQFGRDASSPLAPFAIALEAKRYDSSLRLEDLAGKGWLAAHALGGAVDVWAVGATSEVGDDTVRQLAGMAEARGITLLVLDWAARPLPPLAVALAGAPATTTAWFARHAPSVYQGVLARALAAVAVDPAYPGLAAQLQADLTASQVGLDALRLAASTWLGARLANRTRAQRAFGQFVAVADAGAPAVARPRVLAQLRGALDPAPDGPAVVAMLGGEGEGKTWAVAQWCAERLGAHVPIWVAGPRVGRLAPDDARESLARLLADQDDDVRAERVAGWQRRLRRWEGGAPAGTHRFVIVLDGLNEHPLVRWATVVTGMADAVHALGGRLIVTCRPRFWEAEVAPRLGRGVTVQTVEVDAYDDEELTRVLAAYSVAVASVPERVRAFIRNPRVCAVAVGLLDRLALQPDELTVERLLLEYWRSRLEERGDGVAHTPDEFHDRLRGLARAWLARPRQGFDRGTLLRDDDLGVRRGREALLADVSDIEEGRFVTMDPDDRARYTFRAESLPFAVGLLICREVRDALRTWEPDDQETLAREALARVLDPVGGFDAVADVVAAAVGLACLDLSFPDAGCRALILAWLTLQNVPNDGGAEAMTAYLAARPEPFLDVAETPDARLHDAESVPSLPSLLVARRDHPLVRAAIEARVARWLTRWSNPPARRPTGADAEGETAMLERAVARFAEQRAALSPAEWDLVRRHSHEVPAPAALDLVRLAARLLVGQPLARFAPAFFGWALVQAIVPEMPGTGEGLGWLVRLNRVDPAEARAAVRGALAEVDVANRSEPVRLAAAMLLRLLGDRQSADTADALWPRRMIPGWRRVEQFCDADPFDPDAADSTNLANAVAYAAALRPDEVWTAMSRTTHDGDLDTVTPGLARFDPMVIVDALRRVIRTAPERTHLALRQLVWHLRELTPLFDAACVEAVRSAYDRLRADPTRVAADDHAFVLNDLAASLASHVSGEEHLARIIGFPGDVWLSTRLLDGVQPVDRASLERALLDEAGAHDARRLERVLSFLVSPSAPLVSDLSAEAQRVVTDALTSDEDVAHVAAHLVARADDPALDEALLQAAVARTAPPSPKLYFWSRAVASVVARRRRTDLLPLVDDAYLAPVLVAIEGDAAPRLAARVEAALDLLLGAGGRNLPPSPQDFTTLVDASPEGVVQSRWVRDAEHGDDDPRPFPGSGDLLADAHAYVERQRAWQRAADQHARELREAGVSALHQLPHAAGLRAVVRADPARVGRWVDRLLAVDGARRLSRVANLGMGIASAYASHDAPAAARLLGRLRDVQVPISVRIGPERVGLWHHALFTAADTPPVAALRQAEFDAAASDGALETLTAAAEGCGVTGWLDAYVTTLLVSPGAGDQARALTITGLRRLAPVSGPASVSTLDQEWGTDFLGQAAANARAWRDRGRWTAHWLALAASASAPVTFWRWATLAVGVADARALAMQELLRDSAVVQRFGPDLFEQLRRSAEKRTRDRTQLLFGRRLWSDRVAAEACAYAPAR